MGGGTGVFGVAILLLGGAWGAGIQGNIPGNVNRNQQQNQGGVLNRQAGGLSFAIPGLSLLAGNNGGGGNLFGPATVTRTVVSTVATVTTASFRTCIAPTAALMPCVPGAPAGRRKREANRLPPIRHTPSPSMALIVGGTTMIDPYQVSEYLREHSPSTKSLIYPPGVEEIREQRALEEEGGGEVTTLLYPSQDTPVEEEESSYLQDSPGTTGTPLPEERQQQDEGVTTTSAGLVLDDDLQQETEGEIDQEGENGLVEVDKARVGLGRTTTVTSVIRVTSVATSLATGAMATLTVMYAGCLPQSLPVSGLPCQ